MNAISPIRRGQPFLIGFIILLLAHNISNAQYVTLKSKEISLSEALQEIQRQSGCSIAFVTEKINGAPHLSLNLQHASVEKALNTCFAGLKLKYIKYEDGYSVYRPREKNKCIFLPITGWVFNKKNQPVQGALVTTIDISTQTDSKGFFSIQNCSYTAYIHITSIEDNSMEYFAADCRHADTIRLTKNIESSGDLVVVKGVYPSSLRLSTGNVTSIKYEDIRKQPVSDALGALDNRVPGLVIRQRNGVPGSACGFQLRGQSAVANDNSPLLIVDGMPWGNTSISVIGSGSAQGIMGANVLNAIDPEDIASVEVLKDAAVTATYGSSGSHGVILLTLKKGQMGRPKCTFNNYAGFTKVIETDPLMTTSQYLTMRRDALLGDGQPVNKGSVPEAFVWDTSGSSDFKNILTGGKGFVNEHRFRYTWGNANHQFLFSGNYHRESSVFRGHQDTRRMSVSTNYNYISQNTRLRLQLSQLNSWEKTRLPVTDPDVAVRTYPNTPYPALNNGTAFWSVNGLSFLNLEAMLHHHYESTTGNYFTHANLSYKIISGLYVKTYIGYRSVLSEEQSRLPIFAQDPALNPTGHTYYIRNNANILSLQMGPEYQLYSSIGKFNASLYAEWLQKSKRFSSIGIDGFQNDQDLHLGAGVIAAQVSADKATSRYMALSGHLRYELAERYILTLSGGKDGSGKSGSGSGFVNFGAAGAAWIFSKEEWVQYWLPWLSFGKLRCSYGISGNDQIEDYRNISLYNAPSAARDYHGLQPYIPVSFYNSRLSYEINRKAELGLELGFLRDNICITAAAYRHWTSNQLEYQPLSLQTTLPGMLIGQPIVVLNKGLEFTLKTINLRSLAFRWTSNLTLTIPENKLLRFPRLTGAVYSHNYMEGKSLSEQAGLGYKGVDPVTGLFTFLDLDGNKVLDQRDYIPGGNLELRYYWGLDNSFNYKGWELSFFLAFRKQNGINPYVELYSRNLPGIVGTDGQGNYPTPFLQQHWRRPGDKATFQKLTADPGSEAAQRAMSYISSNALAIDASFLRLKNVELSYTLISPILKKYNITNFTTFLRAQNPLTFTHYPVADPETQDIAALSPLKTFVAGFQIIF
jgi:TonB-linked SusC/RagA family outer membrane protein